ncbi:Uncharacterised protein [Vibrio cholerae]|nr:Uncharacterised protein [Vibrio cholerae]
MSQQQKLHLSLIGIERLRIWDEHYFTPRDLFNTTHPSQWVVPREKALFIGGINQE